MTIQGTRSEAILAYGERVAMLTMTSFVVIVVICCTRHHQNIKRGELQAPQIKQDETHE